MESIVSPFRSPSKRIRGDGIIQKPFNVVKLSPVKTPNGRSGMKSPEKRSMVELEQSARKRARNTVYKQLMQEYDSSDEFFEAQEEKLAARILERKEDQFQRNYGSDVEFEIDVAARPDESDLDSSATESDMNLNLNIASNSDSDLESSVSDSPENENVPKKKPVTRIPSKPRRRDVLASQIKSIFHQDDEILQTTRQKSVKKTVPAKSAKPESADSFTTRMLSSDAKSAPIITGLPHRPFVDQDKSQFEPMPTPELDEAGHIADPEFLSRYMGGEDPSRMNDKRLLDAQAFSLEGPEGYFEQLHSRVKISTTSLSASAPRVTRDHFKRNESLPELREPHTHLYHQWCFELSEGFSINFYGVGSKLRLINDFAENYFGFWWSNTVKGKDMPKIMVVNGYNPNIDFKSIVLQVASILVKDESVKWPKHVSETVPFLVEYMRDQPEQAQLVLIVHNIDGEALRLDKTQGLMARLFGIRQIWAMTSTDHVNAPLMWDSSKAKNINFVWHDLTTFAGYSTELTFKDMLNLGKSKKYVGSLGAKFVLRSLTENHRNLYRLLLQNQLSKMKAASDTRGLGLKGAVKHAIELKTLYSQSLDEFVISNEVTFRTFLKEYLDHKMCQLVKDSAGLELVFVPFTFGEIEELYKEEFES
ncbi:uncharacterized protein LODBEIA_P20410 [Lodderomyces beijingensis]|uniref:Origin recognition complex subunit 2 n=1 Tax=Lodderomyces beijingensis TaxID=1775926 RepID=A0ABP0ZNR2_9ASCO